MYALQMIFRAAALLALLGTWALLICWSGLCVINYTFAKSGRQGKALNCLRTANSAVVRVGRGMRTLAIN